MTMDRRGAKFQRLGCDLCGNGLWVGGLRFGLI